MKTAALYLRVSTTRQDADNQEIALREVAERAGWDITEVFRDVGVSGGKAADERPAFKTMMSHARKRGFNIVMSWSVDRLGRSLQDLVGFLNEIQALGVDLYIHQQGLDTTTPSGRAMFQMCGVFSEFERAIIQERVRAGLAKARANGKRLGRPPVDEDTASNVRDLLTQGAVYARRFRTRRNQCGYGPQD